jgi:Glycosyl transferase family 2
MAETEKIKVHVHALCWNEEKMLPHFFRHYDGVADQFFIYDNGSTDRSVEILKSNPRVVLSDFKTSGDSFVQCALDHYNECWKQSRGKADWVIICNIDEHIYHPNLKKYLTDCTSRGITLIFPEGYEMVSDEFPVASTPLHQTVNYGMRKPFFDKPQIFNPNEIEEINFAPGRHYATPTGRVVVPKRPKVRLLHYKYLGLEYLLSRQSELRAGLRSVDVKNGWGNQYTWSSEQMIAEFDRIKRNSVSVFSLRRHVSALRRALTERVVNIIR